VAGNEITWDIGNLPRSSSGALSYQVAVSGALSVGSSFTNSALIATGQNDPNPTNDTAFVTTTITGACVPASIAAEPESTVACAGAVTFSVGANGTPPLFYQWRKNSAAILAATNGTFSIASAGTNDVAGYDVIVNNACGAVTSSVANLTLSLPPVASNDTYIATEDTPLIVGALGVLDNDTDPLGSPLSAVLASGP